MRLARWGLLLMALVWLVVFTRGDDTVGPSAIPSAAGERGPSHLDAKTAVTEFVGSGSCSATACHGSIAAVDASRSAVLRNEHTTWLSDDAHSRAYQVLFDQRSERIVRNLSASPEPARPAHQNERCLACHTTPRPSSEREVTSWMDADGVGCESCHGASRRWLGPHTTIGWANRPWLKKESLGMRDTKDLVPRARLCAGCHVGDGGSGGIPARDVNHDLIAAGHPQLDFELSAHLENMPSHWFEKGMNASPPTPGDPRPRRAPDFPARAWAIGRVAAVEAGLKLLQARVAAADRHAAPWPEFSEYSCFSCHHGLRDEDWRRGRRLDGTLAGSPRWASWLLPLTDDLVDQLMAEPLARQYAESVRRLAGSMEKTGPDLAAVRLALRDAAQSVDQCLAAIATARFGADEIQRLIARLDRPDAWEHVASWDEATQRYLALVPLRQSWIDLSPGRKADQDRLKIRLEALRRTLTLPDGFDSPSGFGPEKIHPRSGQ